MRYLGANRTESSDGIGFVPRDSRAVGFVCRKSFEIRLRERRPQPSRYLGNNKTSSDDVLTAGEACAVLSTCTNGVPELLKRTF